jgi:putative ABC transport system permease protein
MWTVIGVVGDVRHSGLDVDVESTFYVPHKQTGYAEMTIVAGTAVDPDIVLPMFREAVWSVDPDVPVSIAGSLESLLAGSASDERYRTMLLTLFAAIATVLAAVGVFGITARGVAQRTREMGIRSALGARNGKLVGLILRSNLTSALVGIALGLLAALWTSRLLSGFLFGIDARDPATFLSVAALLLAVCAVASYLPARRASRVDPIEVLRAE